MGLCWKSHSLSSLEQRCFACCCCCCCPPPPYLYQQASLFLRLALPLLFSHLPEIQIPNGNSKFCWEKEINFKEKGKDKPGRRQKEPRIRGSELSSRLPRLTPLSSSSSSSSSAITDTGRLYPRNQTPPPQNSYYLKMKKKSYNNQRSRTRLVRFPSLGLHFSFTPPRAPYFIHFHAPPFYRLYIFFPNTVQVQLTYLAAREFPSKEKLTWQVSIKK